MQCIQVKQPVDARRVNRVLAHDRLMDLVAAGARRVNRVLAHDRLMDLVACWRTSRQPCASAPLFTQCLNSVRSWFLDFSPVGRPMSAGVREPPDLGPPHSLKPGGRHISLVHHLSNSDWYPSAIEAFASSALCVAHPG